MAALTNGWTILQSFFVEGQGFRQVSMATGHLCFLLLSIATAGGLLRHTRMRDTPHESRGLWWWLRKAGDHGRARLIAERAMYELQSLHTDGKPNPETLALPIDVAFAFEMMGDAALCIDPEIARSYWVRAMEEFRYIDSTTQDAEWNEPWIHGWYLESIHRYFLSGDCRDFGWNGEARVADKMRQWLGAAP